MKRTITLPLKAFSINAMTGRDIRHKSHAYIEWSAEVFNKLSTDENLDTIAELREFFDSEKHYYIIDLKFYYPSNVLYTKKGSLSARAHDLSNIEKPLIDLLFLPTYYDQPSPYGCKNLNIDDKYIKKLSSEKLPSEEHKIEIELTITSL